MASEHESWTRLMQWQAIPTIKIRSGLVKVPGKYRDLCIEAARRLEGLQIIQQQEKRREIVQLNDEQLHGLFVLVTGREPEPGEKLLVAIETDRQG